MTKEYRIGNHVHAKRVTDVKYKEDSIIALRAEHFKLLQKDVPQMNIKPAELKHMFLTDYGFTMNSEKGLRVFKRNDLVVYYEKLNEFYIAFPVPTERKRIKYTHQLQNLYFGLHDKDLQMYGLDNITVKQLMELEEIQFDKYMNLKKIMKSNDVFNKKKAKQIGTLSFGEVSKIKRTFLAPTPEGIFEAFNSIFNVTLYHYLRSDVISYFYALNWIGESITRLIEKENKALATEPDFILEEAGIKRLEPLREFPVLIKLAERFSTTTMEVEKWPYNYVFTILFHDKIIAEVQKKHSELKDSYGHNGNT